MLTLITCPTCHHKFSIPEGAMGERQTCPNCQSIFRAGKSVSETDGRSRPAILRASIDKTMLGEMDPPIRYNCPRCKKQLESPASEAGAKKPCPSCGGRLQVPAAPPAAAAQNGLNKTLLASDESNGAHIAPQPVASAPAPLPQAPSVTVSPAAAAPQPAGNQGLWPLSPTARTYAIRGLVAAGVLLVVLFFLGRNAAQAENEKFLANQKQELDKARADIEQKLAMMNEQRRLEKEERSKWEAMVAKHEVDQRRLEDQRELDRRNLAYINDQKLAAEAKDKLDREQRRLEDERRTAKAERDKADLEMRLKMEALQKQLESAKTKETTIITQPAPPAYILPWHGRYYHPWW
jgi:DNA-directed RNA polymerase subunit RPC12/RpoP